MVIKDLLLMNYPVFIQFRFTGRKSIHGQNELLVGSLEVPLTRLLISGTLSLGGNLGEGSFWICTEKSGQLADAECALGLCWAESVSSSEVGGASFSLASPGDKRMLFPVRSSS